jgi:HK97 family phage major capsid protein
MASSLPQTYIFVGKGLFALSPPSTTTNSKGETRMAINLVNLKGKSNRDLYELRNKLHAEAKSHFAANQENWTKEVSEKHDELMSDIGAIGNFIQARDGKMNRLASGLLGAGSKVGENLTLFGRGDSVAEAYGQSEVGLGEIIRAKVLGLNTYAALGEVDPTKGGSSVPTQVAAGVIDLARAKSVLSRAGMQFGVMNSAELRMPKLTTDPTFEVKAENEEFDEDTTMAFGALVFYPLLIGSFVTMSRELAEDAIGFQSVIENALADAFAIQLDRFPLLGASGDQVRVGMLDDTDIGETGSTGSLTWAKIAAEATTIRGLNHEPTAVLLHPTKRDPVLDSVTGGSGEYLGVPPSLANVQMLDSTSITAAKGLVGDFTKLMLVVRGGPLIESTTVGGNSFKKHQVSVKLTWRGDFGITHPNAFRRLAGIS